MTRVLINCPGGWSHGLDSPEKGEGRWAQNLAKLLARSGRYDVFASSGGNPKWGRGEAVRATLLAESEAARLNGVDIYLDSSWWDGKAPLCPARVNVHVHWAPEPYVMQRALPENSYLAYVYRASQCAFMSPSNVNLARTVFLPGAFGTIRHQDDSAKGVVCTARGLSINVGPLDNLAKAVAMLRQSEQVPYTWIWHEGCAPPHPDDRVMRHPPSEPWGIPYHEMMAEIRKVRVNVALGGGGSVMDCAILGIPSVVRAKTTLDFIDVVAERHGALVSIDARPDELAASIGRLLLHDKDAYRAYADDLHAVYADHDDAVALAHFDRFAARALAQG